MKYDMEGFRQETVMAFSVHKYFSNIRQEGQSIV
jgi:hypothetical protein